MLNDIKIYKKYAEIFNHPGTKGEVYGDADKHILIEKPLAMTAEEGQKVVDYCETKGVKIATGLMMRFVQYPV